VSGTIREFPEPNGEVHWTVETGGASTPARYAEVHRDGWLVQTWLWSGRGDAWRATGKAREHIPQPVLDFVASETAGGLAR